MEVPNEQFHSALKLLLNYFKKSLKKERVCIGSLCMCGYSGVQKPETTKTEIQHHYH